MSYTNLLDQMLDAVVAAMCRAGHCGVGLAYPPLPPASNDRPYPGHLWCVVRTDKGAVNETAVREQAAAACVDVPGLCDPVRPGGACFLPDTVSAHASYVFSAHWNRFSDDYGGCYFGGFAVETTLDPSQYLLVNNIKCSLFISPNFKNFT